MADAFPTHNSVDYECSKYLSLGAFIFWPKKKERMSSCGMCYPTCLFAVCLPGQVLQVSALACVVHPYTGQMQFSSVCLGCTAVVCDMEMCVVSNGD